MIRSNGKDFSIELTMIKKRICILIIVFVMNFGNAFAHEDFSIGYNFGNVNVRMLTGYQYEVSIYLLSSQWETRGTVISKGDRTLLYLADEDRLIQDLDKLVRDWNFALP